MLLIALELGGSPLTRALAQAPPRGNNKFVRTNSQPTFRYEHSAPGIEFEFESTDGEFELHARTGDRYRKFGATTFICTYIYITIHRHVPAELTDPSRTDRSATATA